MDAFIQQSYDFFMVFGKEAALFIVSMIPIIELRGSIPLGAAMGMPALDVFCISVIGNMLPVPFILWIGKPLIQWLGRTRLFSRLANWYEGKLMGKRDKLTKYETFGLLLFVAIPLPGTGAWSGAALAALLGLRFRWAMLSIAGGVLAAGVIMTLISYGIAGVAGVF